MRAEQAGDDVFGRGAGLAGGLSSSCHTYMTRQPRKC